MVKTAETRAQRRAQDCKRAIKALYEAIEDLGFLSHKELEEARLKSITNREPYDLATTFRGRDGFCYEAGPNMYVKLWYGEGFGVQDVFRLDNHGLSKEDFDRLSRDFAARLKFLGLVYNGV